MNGGFFTEKNQLEMWVLYSPSFLGSQLYFVGGMLEMG